jgi:hypothetical protein
MILPVFPRIAIIEKLEKEIVKVILQLFPESSQYNQMIDILNEVVGEPNEIVPSKREHHHHHHHQDHPGDDPSPG